MQLQNHYLLYKFTTVLGLMITSVAVAAPAAPAAPAAARPVFKSIYPFVYHIPNSDLSLLYSGEIREREVSIGLAALTLTINAYLLHIIYPAMNARGGASRLLPQEDIYAQGRVVVHFKGSVTMHYPVLSDVEAILTGMKGAAADPRYRAVEEANIAVFQGTLGMKLIAGVLMTVLPGGERNASSLAHISSSSNIDVV